MSLFTHAIQLRGSGDNRKRIKEGLFIHFPSGNAHLELLAKNNCATQN
jgi:hypothetical protein